METLGMRKQTEQAMRASVWVERLPGTSCGLFFFMGSVFVYPSTRSHNRLRKMRVSPLYPEGSVVLDLECSSMARRIQKRSWQVCSAHVLARTTSGS